ncbi:MAG TPA: response regulator [Terriglobia bacterium]|jgi:CheY-like chemotaxis protein
MRRTILLADDSPTIRRLVTQTFADANFKIVEVSNGDAAIKAVEEVRPSIVLADIYMPGKNGYEVCTYVRNHPTLNSTPVILLVGAFDAFDDETAKQAGATANITKPFEPGALIELVTSVLARGDVADSGPEPDLPAKPARKREPAHEPRRESVPAAQTHAAPAEVAPSEEDLLGLELIFKEEPALATGAMSEADIDRIADRVIQKLSTQVIESIAWDIVPDITEKIVRQELRRIDEG